MDIRTWADLKKTIEDCPYNRCPRNKSKKQIYFERKECINKIKFLVISEEVGSKHFCKEPAEVKNLLLEELKCKKGNVPKKIKKIFNNGNIDIKPGDVYWTHTLKCIPPKDHLRGDSCFIFCGNLLKTEIMLMSNLAAIITFG